jgi:hypothetical protein
MRSLLNEIWRTGWFGAVAFALGAFLKSLWDACLTPLPEGTTRHGRIRGVLWRLSFCLLPGSYRLLSHKGPLDWPVLAGLAVVGASLDLILPPVGRALGWIFSPVARALVWIIGPIVRTVSRIAAPVIRLIPQPTAFHFVMGMVLWVCLGLAVLLVVGVMDLHAGARPGN